MKHAVWLLLVASVVSADPKQKAPHGVKHISLDYTWQSFSSDEWHAKVDWNGTTFATDKKHTIDPKLIDALYASLTNLKPTSEPQRCISHTDDYPEFKISVDGDEPLTINSDSNCHAYMPWNITVGGKLNVQYTADVFRALRPILAAADDRWKKGANEPIASTGFGYEMVGLGEYTAGQPPKSDAAKCALSFEANPQAKLVLGTVKVERLDLGCNPSESADCSSATASTEFDWQGLEVQMQFPCKAGQTSITPEAVKTLTAVQSFVTSKPVRALVKLSKNPPQLRNDGADWSLEGDADGAPMMTWNEKTKVIAARAFGETIAVTYWKELGIDIKPLMKKDNGFFELDLKLDLAGKRVK